jgi:hypothetical protein
MYSPYLSYSQLVHYDLLWVLNANFQYFILPVTLQETDLVALLDGPRKDSHQSDHTPEMIIAVSSAPSEAV